MLTEILKDQMLAEVRSPSELEVLLIEAFMQADTQGLGALDAPVLTEALRNADLGLSRLQIHSILEDAEYDEDGLIDYRKFAPKAAELIYRIADIVATEPVMGGASTAPVTPEITAVALSVSGEARRRYLGIEAGVMAKVTPFPSWEPVEAMTQVVAGTNYFIKVQISETGLPPEYVQLRVFQGVDGTIELHDMLQGAEAEGPVRYF